MSSQHRKRASMSPSEEQLSDVLVAGAGIAGLAVARALGSRGRSVRVVELEKDWGSGGSGLLLHGPAVRALAALGLLEDVKRSGFCLQEIVYLDGESQVTATARLPQLAGAEEPGAVGIMRHALREVLFDGARAAGAEVLRGVTVRSLEATDDGVAAELTDGTTVRCGFVIGADGIRSSLREMLFGDEVRPEYTGTVVWRAMLGRPRDVDRFYVFNGRTVVCGLCPVSFEKMYIFVVEAMPDFSVLDPRREPERMQDLLSDFTGLAGELREEITDPSQVVRRPVESVLDPLPWHRLGTVLIGDAVHAPPPTLAAGAAIALEDAVVLAEMVCAAGRRDDVLEAFGNRRWERCRLVVESSLQRNEAQLEGRDFDTVSFERAVWSELAKPA